MASESSSLSSSNSKNAGESYVGSFISLISKCEIRYEGVLYCLNVQDSTIGLKNVRSYGTEGRKIDGPQVAHSDKVYEFILFRGSDIKDLQVKSSPPAQTEEQIHNDPAIIQSQSYSPSPSVGGKSTAVSTRWQDTPAMTNETYSSAHYAGVPLSLSSSALVDGKSVTEMTQWQDTPAVTTRAYHGALQSYQSLAQVGPPNHSQVAQNAGGPSFSTPLYWQGYNGTSISVSHALPQSIPFQFPSTVSSPVTMQNRMQNPEINASPVTGLINAAESFSPVPSIASNSLHINFMPSITPVQCSTSDMPSSSSMKASLLSHAAYMTANSATMSSFPSSCQNTKTTDAQVFSKNVSDPSSDPAFVHCSQSMPYYESSFVSSASGLLLTPPPSLLTPDQLVQSRSHVLSSTQKVNADQKDMGALSPISYNALSKKSTTVTQAPLLPLPVSMQQSQYSTTQFTEEFDFEAMNEKFRKDEVWGYLGKARQGDKTDGGVDNVTNQSSVDKDFCGMVPNFDPKPAYQKDEFFDMISCNSQTRGARNGQNRFSERMELDSETFGNFQHRPDIGYGSYGAGHGERYRGLYNWARGYGYGGRGRGGPGGNMHI